MLTADERRLVADHVWLADRLADRYGRQDSTAWDDAARSAAYLGLIDAAKKWEPGRASFRSYARVKIIWAMRSEVRALVTGRRSKTDIREQAHLSRDDQNPVFTQDRRRDVPLDLDRVPYLSGAVAESGTDPAEIYEATETREEVAAAVGALSDRDRRMVRCYYFERLTLEAIAAREGVTEGAVSLRLKKIRARLRWGIPDGAGDGPYPRGRQS